MYCCVSDPLALLLRGDIYVKLTLPDPAPIEVLRSWIEELVRTMTPDERKQALERVTAFKDYQNVVEQELLRGQAFETRRE